MLSRQIAQKLRGYETPFYLYDTALLRQTLESVVYESKKYGYKVHYAIKANYDDHLLAIIREYGLGIDCASGNELRKAVEAGFDPKGIVYAGVGKRDKELKYAIEQNILAINCESIQELELVDALSAEAGKVTDIALRINPDIDPKTNHCIDTGQADSKFGISYEEVLEHAKEIKSLKHINIVGIHLHIGSQIRELHVFENMCNKVNVIVENLEKLGFSFRFVDVGGGLGVNYDVPENEPIPNFASLFSIVHNHLAVGDREVHFEFGRSIVAECGELITTVLFNKTTATGRKLVIVDASMTELEVRSHLAKLGFRGDTVFKPCEALSGGELARLRFAEIVLERPNLLFLDEPTNHLDIYTRENLTEALMAYTGTLLLVTHDRHLMNSLACPILYLEDGKAVLYPSYDALMGRAAPVQAAQKAAEPAKTGYGKEQRRRRAELRAKIKACEDEMEACGAREVELDNEINSPEVYNDPDLLRQKSDELSDLRFHQEELFAAWEAAMEEQEAYEQTQQPEE